MRAPGTTGQLRRIHFPNAVSEAFHVTDPRFGDVRNRAGDKDASSRTPHEDSYPMAVETAHVS